MSTDSAKAAKSAKAEPMLTPDGSAEPIRGIRLPVLIYTKRHGKHLLDDSSLICQAVRAWMNDNGLEPTADVLLPMELVIEYYEETFDYNEEQLYHLWKQMRGNLCQPANVRLRKREP